MVLTFANLFVFEMVLKYLRKKEEAYTKDKETIQIALEQF